MQRALFRVAALLVLPAFLGGPVAVATAPRSTPDAAGLAKKLAKLRVVGKVLYVAAHPDDENTAFLAWAANGKLVDTAYLSMTRGDGGQNLIGSEKGELIGLIRTQELLAARRIDGAQQLFTRAVDFGYSKNPEETLAIWGKDAVLSDTVRAIRTFRPDVIVTRFPTTGEGGHGHHTASAILAEEAFKAAADPARFPEQGLAPWQAKRILWNVFRFGANAPRKEIPGGVAIDLGAYDVLLGRSYTELAGESRSMHKSQGFGSAERRGVWLNDFQLMAGEPVADGDLFSGVDLTWKRVPGAEAADALLAKAQSAFDPSNPSAIVPTLLAADDEMAALPASPTVKEKRAELKDAVRACLGLWLEAVAKTYEAVPGSEVKITALALNRSPLEVKLETATLSSGGSTISTGVPEKLLKFNTGEPFDTSILLPAHSAYTQPYWLAEPGAKGLFKVRGASLVGRPESPAAITAAFVLNIAGRSVTFEEPVVYRWTDPVRGEQYRTFSVVPKATLTFDDKVLVFSGAKPRTVNLTVRNAVPAKGTVKLTLPEGWKSTPAEAPFDFATADGEQRISFLLTPNSVSGTVSAVATFADGGTSTVSETTIDYPHIPIQTLFPPAEARLVRLAAETPKKRVGYVMGSGDEIPAALRQLGMEVTLLTDDDLAGSDLSRYDAIVAGIRAYNTRPRLKQLQPKLLAYVEKGGTLVVQYNTSGSDLVTKDLGPYPFELSRERVTVEEAPVTFLAKASPLLTTPNAISDKDFEGWVQERGLYFAGKWDPKYTAVLAASDPGEPAREGGLLYAKHGKGAFVFTGYSFFRQLPAGVPGAYRLFVNLVCAK